MELHSSLRIKLFYQSLSQPILQGTIDLDEEEEKEKKSSCVLSFSSAFILSHTRTHSPICVRKKEAASALFENVHPSILPSIRPSASLSIHQEKKKENEENRTHIPLCSIEPITFR